MNGYAGQYDSEIQPPSCGEGWLWWSKFVFSNFSFILHSFDFFMENYFVFFAYRKSFRGDGGGLKTVKLLKDSLSFIHFAVRSARDVKCFCIFHVLGWVSRGLPFAEWRILLTFFWHRKCCVCKILHRSGEILLAECRLKFKFMENCRKCSIISPTACQLPSTVEQRQQEQH